MKNDIKLNASDEKRKQNQREEQRQKKLETPYDMRLS